VCGNVMRVYNSAFIPTYGFAFCWARVVVMCFLGLPVVFLK
jgi:hypothetical protein